MQEHIKELQEKNEKLIAMIEILLKDKRISKKVKDEMRHAIFFNAEIY